MFDYNDVSECNILRLVNEFAVSLSNNYLRNAYKFDYFIQIDFSAVNGLTLKVNKEKNEKKPVANIFLKVKIRIMILPSSFSSNIKIWMVQP